jgi:hypothetical protein
MRLLKRSGEPSITFESFGVPVEIVFSDPDLEAPVREVLPPGYRSVGGAGGAERF